MPEPVTAEAVAAQASFATPTWSPDGARLAWVELRAGEARLLVAAAGDPSETAAVNAEPVTSAAKHGGTVFTWVGDDGLAYVARDGRLRVAGLDGRPEVELAGDGTAAAPVHRAGRLAWVLDTGKACDVVVAPADGSAEPSPVSHADFAWDPTWSPDGQMLAWHEWDLPHMPWDESRIVVADVDELREGRPTLLAGGSGTAVGQPRFSPDGTHLAWVSDETGWMNLWVAPPDGSDAAPWVRGDLECAEPSWGPGQRSYAWSPDGRAVAVTINRGGSGELWTADGWATCRSTGWHRGLDWGPGGIVAVVSDAATPPHVSRVEPRQADAAPAVEPGAPLLVRIHGGPTGQSLHDWDARTEFWRSRGWNVLAPNPPGSTGYGRAFAQALRGQWGVADVEHVAATIRDATDATDAGSDADRVVVMGGSAGGFTALLVAAHHPELVHAVVALYPVTDLRALAAHDYRFESGYTDWLAGDAYERSPVAVADRIRAPVLLLHGDADPVVPSAQARRMVDSIERGGGQVELHEYEGEGHGWRRPETVVDELIRTEAFLARWAGPR